MYKLFFFILIPFLLFSQIRDEDQDKFIKHTVQSYDSFYTLKSKYDVTRRELVLYNPFLKGSIYLDEFRGQEILIPIKKRNYNNFSKLRIGVLLPFHTDLIDSLVFQDENISINDIDYRSFKSIDFYRGFLFSVNEAMPIKPLILINLKSFKVSLLNISLI